MIFASILYLIIGAILGIVSVMFAAAFAMHKMSKDGKFASARYDKDKNEWRVIGKFGGIAQKLADIRAGRQPGAIKYID